MRRRPDNEKQGDDAQRPVDWERIRSGPTADPVQRERPPFRLGGEVEAETGGSEIDPWKALLERGSMQEVLASVRRVAGVPEDDDEPPPAAKEPPRRAKQPPRPVPKPPREAAAPRRPSPVVQGEPPPWREPGPAARRRPTPQRGGTGPEEVERASRPPRPAPTPRPTAPPIGATDDDEPAPRRATIDRAPRPEDELAGVRRRASDAAARHRPSRADRMPAATEDDPPLALGERTVIPRRPGPASVVRDRSRTGSVGLIVLLLVGLSIGIGIGVVTQMERWTMPFGMSLADIMPSAGEETATAPEQPDQPPDDQTALTAADMVEAPPPTLDLEQGAGGPLVEDERGEETSGAQVFARADPTRPNIAPLFIGRVFVHYSTDSDEDGARGRALEVARALEERGYRIAAVRPVDFAIRSGSVRYFFPDDLAAAARLQEDLPAALATRTDLMDFTSYEPRPRPGAIELWLNDAS